MIGLLFVYGIIAINALVLVVAGRRQHGSTRKWWRS